MPTPEAINPSLDITLATAYATIQNFLSDCRHTSRPVNIGDYHGLLRPANGPSVCAAIGSLIRTYGAPVIKPATPQETLGDATDFYLLQNHTPAPRMVASAWTINGSERVSLKSFHQKQNWRATEDLQLGDQRVGDCLRTYFLDWKKLKIETSFYSPDFYIKKLRTPKHPRPMTLEAKMEIAKLRRAGRTGIIDKAPALLTQFLALVPPQF